MRKNCKKYEKSVLYASMSLAACLTLIACGSPYDSRMVDPDSAGSLIQSAYTTVGLADIVWEECPLITFGTGEERADCATVPVPARRDVDTGKEVNLWIKRKLREGADKQIWVLQGGPGGSVTASDYDILEFAERGNADVYLYEHRGVGFSDRLTCENEAGELYESPLLNDFEADKQTYQECIDSLQTQWGVEGLKGFNTTEAAMDVIELIKANAESNKKVYLFGFSYGTYISHRIMLLNQKVDEPAPLDGVILDGVLEPVFPDTFIGYAVGYDQNNHDTMLKLMDACRRDAKCHQYLGFDPAWTLSNLWEKLDAGHCSEITDEIHKYIMKKTGSFSTRWLLGWSVGLTTLRGVIPAMIHRLDRCNEGDIKALKFLIAGFFFDSRTPEQVKIDWAPLLFRHIVHTELWRQPDPIPRDDYEAFYKWILSGGSGASPTETHFFEMMPKYTPEQDLVGPLADNTNPIPMLIMGGTMDPATPFRIGQRIFNHFNAANQHRVIVDRAAHGVLNGSPIPGAADPRDTCGWNLVGQFLTKPEGPLDTSCKTQMLPFDFTGSPGLAASLFNSGDIYENTTPPPIPTWEHMTPRFDFRSIRGSFGF